MKNKIKVSRANFPGVGNFSWMNYFVSILSEKYDVIIDSENPDIVFYSNLHYGENELDYYTNTKNRGHHVYSNNVKKIFISGEARPDYMGQLSLGNNFFCLGYEHINHPNYLRFPTYVLDVFVLHNEANMFAHHFGWMTEKRNADEIMSNKKYFCSIVQASNNDDRSKFFDLITQKHFIKSSGPWRPTVDESESIPNKYQYHNYSNKDYMGRIDGLTYRDKIQFFENCHFNISFQWTNTDYLTQEKIVHAYAANTIPIFYGNQYIEEEGFNPNSFINVHNYESFEHCFEFIDNLYNNKPKLRSFYDEPIFNENKLPIYFDKDYLLDFFDKVISK